MDQYAHRRPLGIDLTRRHGVRGPQHIPASQAFPTLYNWSRADTVIFQRPTQFDVQPMHAHYQFGSKQSFGSASAPNTHYSYDDFSHIGRTLERLDNKNRTIETTTPYPTLATYIRSQPTSCTPNQPSSNWERLANNCVDRCTTESKTSPASVVLPWDDSKSPYRPTRYLTAYQRGETPIRPIEEMPTSPWTPPPSPCSEYQPDVPCDLFYPTYDKSDELVKEDATTLPPDVVSFVIDVKELAQEVENKVPEPEALVLEERAPSPVLTDVPIIDETPSSPQLLSMEEFIVVSSANDDVKPDAATAHQERLETFRSLRPRTMLDASPTDRVTRKRFRDIAGDPSKKAFPGMKMYQIAAIHDKRVKLRRTAVDKKL